MERKLMRSYGVKNGIDLTYLKNKDKEKGYNGTGKINWLAWKIGETVDCFLNGNTISLWDGLISLVIWINLQLYSSLSVFHWQLAKCKAKSVKVDPICTKSWIIDQILKISLMIDFLDIVKSWPALAAAVQHVLRKIWILSI